MTKDIIKVIAMLAITVTHGTGTLCTQTNRNNI